jgi:hypothetical protein
MDTTQKIDAYFASTEELTKIRIKKQEVIDLVVIPEMKEKIQEFTDQIINKKVKQKLRDIEIEFAGFENIASGNIVKLKAEITKEVLGVGKTVRASDEKRMAMYRKGTSSWDGDKLMGFSAAHPEILQSIKSGNLR